MSYVGQYGGSARQYIGAGGPGGGGPATCLSRYRQIEGWDPSLLLCGDLLIDQVGGEVFSLVNGATVDNATDGLFESTLNRGMYTLTDNTTDAVQAPNSSLLDVPDAPVSCAELIVFRVPAFGAFTALSLFGKRDPIAPNLGREWLVNSDGSLTCRLDTTGGVVDSVLNGVRYDQNQWHVACCIIDRVAGEVRMGSADEFETIQPLPAGSAINAVTAALGAQRRPAIGADILIAGFQMGPQVEGADANAKSEAMAVELFFEQLFDDAGAPRFDDAGNPRYARRI